MKPAPLRAAWRRGAFLWYTRIVNTTLIALVAVLMLGVGIYISISGLATQYALEPSGGSAAGVACTPHTAESRVNQPVRFTASGLTVGTLYHWASDKGRSEVQPGGGLEVRFAKPGSQTIYLFHAANSRWYRTACSVLIR